MKFIDVAEIFVKAGDGGTGLVHFRREKYVPFGGPDGGDGGDGGSIYLVGSNNLNTLLDFKYKRHHEAEDGGKGGTSNKTGRSGTDVILKVPCGTVVIDADTSEVLGEIITPEQSLLVAKGGKGGVGNLHFATSSNQAPLKVIPPKQGERRKLLLELKLIADVAIIGLPNAGKSTLITAISEARPKIADYPFTTLVPTLGVVVHKGSAPFVVADVPGLIPGASEGKGLGHEFLRHIERTKIIVHLIDSNQEQIDNLITDYHSILKEMELYNPELVTRHRITVISKVDNLQHESPENTENTTRAFSDYLNSIGVAHFKISAALRQGIEPLLDAILAALTN